MTVRFSVMNQFKMIRFALGEVVIVCGLQSAAAQALNGTTAVITTSAPNEKGRWGINVGNTRRITVKAVNVRVLSAAELRRFVSPAVLSDWSPTRRVSSEFLDAMSGVEKMRSNFGVQQSPEFGNRESWTLIANYIDSANGVAPDERLCRGGQVPPSYTPGEAVRIMYQCTDEGRGVIIDIIGVKSRLPADGIEEPVILCHYCEITREQMGTPGFSQRVIVQTSRASSRGHSMASMNVELDEHAVVMRMLRKNEKLLDPTFRSHEAERRSASDGWRTSFVSPTSVESKPSTSKKTEAAAMECSRPGCAKRGKSTCNRCKKVKYCSITCQKAHWKGGHKKECKAPTRPFVEYDVSFIEPSQRSMFHMNMSNQQSVRAMTADRIAGTGIHQSITSEQKAAKGVKALAQRAKVGGNFTIKVQCARGGGSFPLMTYDRKRDLNVLLAKDAALPASTSERHRSDDELRELIQTYGEVGGQKGYCTACAGSEPRFIRIYVDKLEAPKAW